MIVKNPREEKAILKVQKIYLDAERKIVAEITRKRRLGLVDYAEVAALERVQQILTDMQSESFLYIPEMVETIFHGQGAKNAAGYENARALTATETAVVQTLANNLLGEVIAASSVVLQSARDYLAVARLEGDEFREAALEAVASQQAIGNSWTIAQKSMKADLVGRGITAFIDKAGRRWTLTDYCNMAVRTTAKQAGVAAILTRDDYDLWQIVRIGSTCPVCAVYEGRVYSKSGTNPDYPPLASAFGKIDTSGPDTLENTYLNIHPNCLVPGGAILAEGIVAESRRRYRGEVITLTTASGNEITVTPNHPILTSKGFVAAGAIKEGFEVIKATGKYRRLIGQAPNNINVPTIVNEVFHARMKALSSATHRVKGSAVQFHGDGGAESEVNIILPYRFRVGEWNIMLGKPLGKDNFPPAHSRRIQFLPFGAFLKIIKGALRSFNSFMSGFGFVSSVEGIPVDGEQFADLGQRAPTFSGNLSIRQTLIMKLKETSKLLFMSFLKGFRNIGKAFSSGSADAFKPINVFGINDMVHRDPELFGNLTGGESLLKQRLKDLFSNNAIVKDAVVHVCSSFYDGYVYNLETEQGFYVYNNIVTHNCLHSLVKYTTIGKTEKQIQKDKDFSSFEKNPITHDPRTKKQREAYQTKMRNRQRLLNDTRQWKKYKAALGKDIPNFDTFLKHKRADDEIYKGWMKQFREFNKEADNILEAL